MDSKGYSNDLSMNTYYLNIINSFFLFLVSPFAFILNNINVLIPLFSLFFLIILNIRKAAIEVSHLYRILIGKEKLLKKEKKDSSE